VFYVLNFLIDPLQSNCTDIQCISNKTLNFEYIQRISGISTFSWSHCETVSE